MRKYLVLGLRGTLSKLSPLALLVGATTGCATIGLANPRHTDVAREATREPMLAPEGHFVTVEQDGAKATVIASRACELRETTKVDRTTRAERVNKTPAVDWTFGGLGVGLVATGAIAIVDSRNVSPTDRTGRQYNPVGPDAALGIGAAVAATGVALGTIAVVDMVRASGEVETKGSVTVPGKVIERGVHCANQPFAGAEVTVALPGRDEPTRVGLTGPDGKLNIDLDSVVPNDQVLRQQDALRVLVDGEPAGSIKLEALYVVREAAAWQTLKGDSCAQPTSSSACDDVRWFLRRYPDGVHAEQAREIVAGAEPALARLKDEEAWRKLDSAGCQGLDDEKADDIAAACSGIEAYIVQFPGGPHETVAREMLRKGRAVEKQRRAKEERDERADAAKERAAEERAQQKAKACVQRKCTALCKVRCPYSQSCLEGCIELCAGSGSLESECGVSR